MEEGSIVTRESYNNDICFRICNIEDNIAILKGTSYRLIADANLDDLNMISKKEYEIKESDINRNIDSIMNKLIYDSCNIDNYRNTKCFMESVKIARRYNYNYDELVIFAGGCQSYYEELMDSGSNFASSPNRILIHYLDPVLLAYQIATTSVREFIDIEYAVKDTFGGIGGIGGIETRGQSREIKPTFKHKKIY